MIDRTHTLYYCLTIFLFFCMEQRRETHAFDFVGSLGGPALFPPIGAFIMGCGGGSWVFFLRHVRQAAQMQPKSDLPSSSHCRNQLHIDSALLTAATSLFFVFVYFIFCFFFCLTHTLEACTDMCRQHMSVAFATTHAWGISWNSAPLFLFFCPTLIRCTEVNTFVVRTRLELRCLHTFSPSRSPKRQMPMKSFFCSCCTLLWRLFQMLSQVYHLYKLKLWWLLLLVI